MACQVTSGHAVHGTYLAPSKMISLDAIMDSVLKDVAKGEPSPNAKESNLDTKGKILLASVYQKLSVCMDVLLTPISQQDSEAYRRKSQGFFASINLSWYSSTKSNLEEICLRIKTELAATSMHPKTESLRNFLSPYFVQKMLDLQTKHGWNLNLSDDNLANPELIPKYIEQILKHL